jgi:DMSO reductase anchor subunit
MHAAPSILIFTVTAGLGQGLFIALLITQWMTASAEQPVVSPAQFAVGGALALTLIGIGLIASFFHLGQKMRAWRAAAMWRTSWMSREVIVMPLTMAVIFFWSVAHWFGSPAVQWLSVLGLVLTFALWYCTAMIYACLRFLQEWAHPLTIANYTLIGLASGFTLAAFFFAVTQPEIQIWPPLAILAIAIAAVVRVISLRRNAQLKPKSTVQSALGIKSPRIEQKTQGAMGGSFNTREFFHGQTVAFVKRARLTMLLLGFVVPALLVLLGWSQGNAFLFGLAVVVQYIGLLAERWVFFAQANHPQNIYYQVVS